MFLLLMRKLNQEDYVLRGTSLHAHHLEAHAIDLLRQADTDIELTLVEIKRTWVGGKSSAIVGPELLLDHGGLVDRKLALAWQSM